MNSAALRSNFLQTGCQWKGGVNNLECNKRNAGKMFVKCSVNSKIQKTEKEVRIGVLGASGYTGSEEDEHNEKLLIWKMPKDLYGLYMFRNYRTRMSAGNLDKDTMHVEPIYAHEHGVAWCRGLTRV